MNKTKQTATTKKRKRRTVILWACAVWFPLFFISLCLLPLRTVTSPENESREGYSIVFSKHLLEWTSHEVTLRYSTAPNQWRYVTVDIEDPFQIDSVLYETDFPSYMACAVSGTIRLVDPARNEIACQFWCRVLENTDVMVFLDFENPLQRNFPLHYSVRYQDENIQNRSGESTIDADVFRYSSSDYWEETTQLQKVSVDTPESFGEAMIGRLFQDHKALSSMYTGVVFPYRKSEFGIYQHLPEVESITYMKWTDQDEWEISSHSYLLENSHIRDWFVVSSKPMLDIDSAPLENVMLITDLALKKGYFQDGFYYSTYLSGYENESPTSFYWDYSMYAPRSILEYYYEEEQSFLYDLCVNSLYALLETRNSEGYWTNGTVSKWLRDEYSMQDRYFDTRFCTDAALFMIRLYEKFEIQEAKEAASKIGDLLVDGIRRGFCYQTSNYGFMLQDYFIFEHPEIRVHSSLNHLLNESSFLLLLGDVTGVETYSNAAWRIINSLNATNNLWKNPVNHDLHYARLPNGEFGLQDYVTLTYYDLLRFREFITDYGEKVPPFVQNLGQWKEQFLMGKNIVHTPKFTGHSEDLSPLVKRDEKK